MTSPADDLGDLDTQLRLLAELHDMRAEARRQLDETIHAAIRKYRRRELQISLAEADVDLALGAITRCW